MNNGRQTWRYAKTSRCLVMLLLISPSEIRHKIFMCRKCDHFQDF